MLSKNSKPVHLFNTKLIFYHRLPIHFPSTCLVQRKCTNFHKLWKNDLHVISSGYISLTLRFILILIIIHQTKTPISLVEGCSRNGTQLVMSPLCVVALHMMKFNCVSKITLIQVNKNIQDR